MILEFLFGILRKKELYLLYNVLQRITIKF